MILTTQQIISLAEAIAQLDGQHILQVIEGKAVTVFKSYRIASAARWLLACAQGKLQAIIADFNRAKDTLIQHHTGGETSIAADHPNFNSFIADLEKLKQQAVDLHLDQIALDQLKLEENERAGNEFSIAVLNALAPLVKDTPKMISRHA